MADLSTVPTIRIPVSKPCLSPLEHQLVCSCLQRNQLTQGLMVARFERELAQYLGVKHVVATTSGTTALHLALAALGVGAGDEVLVPDLTFVATANAVSYTGARPVLVDVLPESWCIDVADARRKITERTKAIIPVHLYGAPCDMPAISGVAGLAQRHHKLAVIEDAAEGLGGNIDGHQLGTFGHAAAFSFYANKILTTSEGGAVVTDSLAFADNLRFLRGQALSKQQYYFHDAVGFNYRMTELQAAIGVGQLSHLDEMLAARRAIIRRYAERLGVLAHSPGYRAPCADGEHHAPWLFTFTLPNIGVNRDELAQHLLTHGIETRPTFQPLHRMPMYSRTSITDGFDFPMRMPHFADADFLVASRIADTGLSLPTYPQLPLSAVDEICGLVLEFCQAATSEGSEATHG